MGQTGLGRSAHLAGWVPAAQPGEPQHVGFQTQGSLLCIKYLAKQCWVEGAPALWILCSAPPEVPPERDHCTLTELSNFCLFVLFLFLRSRGSLMVMVQNKER